jgi:hypothetical protein
MLTLFHGQKYCDYVDRLDIDIEIKNNFKKLVHDFMKELFEIADFDPNADSNNKMKSNIEGFYTEF